MKHPTPTATVVDLFARSPERRLALLRAVWPVAVGSDLARRSEIVAFDGGILRVRVPDAAWRKVLFRMRGDILVRLRRAAGAAAPRTLGFVEGPVPEPPRTEPAKTPPTVGVLSTAVAEAARAIADTELQARFVESARRYLARFGDPS